MIDLIDAGIEASLPAAVAEHLAEVRRTIDEHGVKIALLNEELDRRNTERVKYLTVEQAILRTARDMRDAFGAAPVAAPQTEGAEAADSAEAKPRAHRDLRQVVLRLLAYAPVTGCTLDELVEAASEGVVVPVRSQAIQHAIKRLGATVAERDGKWYLADPQPAAVAAAGQSEAVAPRSMPAGSTDDAVPHRVPEREEPSPAEADGAGGECPPPSSGWSSVETASDASTAETAPAEKTDEDALTLMARWGEPGISPEQAAMLRPPITAPQLARLKDEGRLILYADGRYAVPDARRAGPPMTLAEERVPMLRSEREAANG